ncbi:hypothetical protein [Methanosarcina spelaei]|jgi:hypothetical protein|uniref:hypothetical protein n=1 Tax=Methanosarcina spelaei TaxID=1036679 RepID=UPI001140DD50|nr:hypothetical protein [Methanosarcina spelaei]
MGILKKTMSVLVLVFFVASLTVGSASAGWNSGWNSKCDCNKGNYCNWGCNENSHKNKCCCGCDDEDDFDYESFFKYFFGDSSFFGDSCFLGTGSYSFGGW